MRHITLDTTYLDNPADKNGSRLLPIFSLRVQVEHRGSIKYYGDIAFRKNFLALYGWREL